MNPKKAYVISMMWMIAAMLWALANNSPGSTKPEVSAAGVRCVLSPSSGLPEQIETSVGPNTRRWLQAPMTMSMVNQSTGTGGSPLAGSFQGGGPGRGLAEVSGRCGNLPVLFSTQWGTNQAGLSWDWEFKADSAPAAHLVCFWLPILAPNLKVFTPTDHRVFDMAVCPSYQGTYSTKGWYLGESYLLPLVSVFDPNTDSALTIGLPADQPVTHLTFGWSNSRDLYFYFAFHGIGSNVASDLKLLLLTHPADYRSTVKTYSDLYPEYFRPGLPRTSQEGAFFYHHVQNHPDFEEMARQNVRYAWAGFYQTRLGEFLPEASVWKPFTYRNYLWLQQLMSDDCIRSFVTLMREHGIKTYAYYALNEFGGTQGDAYDTYLDERYIRESLADAIMLDPGGKPLIGWENSFIMNAKPDYSYWPLMAEQVRRYLERLPEFDGFIVDRTDYGATWDFGHFDGRTMVLDRPFEHTAVGERRALREVIRMAHEAGKQVFLNGSFRIDLLKNVDGICSENYFPALEFYCPFRPAGAWTKYWLDYSKDLLELESTLKTRLQTAVLPHFIGHQFRCTQQEPAPCAADLMEIYAPLYAKLIGKEQVLLPHCVSATGPNEVNLFINPSGEYIVPLISRLQFLSRPPHISSPATITLRLPDNPELSWAHVLSCDGPPSRASLSRQGDRLSITLDQHCSASLVTVGKGSEPPLDEGDADRLQLLRQRLFPSPPSNYTNSVSRPEVENIAYQYLRCSGTHLGTPGPVSVYVNGRLVGSLSKSQSEGIYSIPMTQLDSQPPRVCLRTGTEGTWFYPRQVELGVVLTTGEQSVIASWRPGTCTDSSSSSCLCLMLNWVSPTYFSLE